eukprot:4471972-Amphidinium_carterae.1
MRLINEALWEILTGDGQVERTEVWQRLEVSEILEEDEATSNEADPGPRKRRGGASRVYRMGVQVGLGFGKEAFSRPPLVVRRKFLSKRLPSGNGSVGPTKVRKEAANESHGRIPNG